MTVEESLEKAMVLLLEIVKIPLSSRAVVMLARDLRKESERLERLKRLAED